MTTARKRAKKSSNNPKNQNKNICGLHVAKYLRCADKVHYLHYMDDLVRACRKKWTVRSRASKVKGKSIGSQRDRLKKLAEEIQQEGKFVAGFMIGIEGHVLFTDAEGQTIVDTDPRKRDRRKITEAYIVYADARQHAALAREQA